MREFRRTDLDISPTTESETAEALRLMNETMGLTISAAQWERIRDGCFPKRGLLVVARKDGEIVSVVAIYPRRIRLADGRNIDTLMNGQLCSRSTGRMRKRGAAAGVLTHLERLAADTLDIDVMTALTGERLHRVYYRKLYGYSRVPLAMDVFQYFDFHIYLADFCASLGRRYRGSTTLVVGLNDGTGAPCVVRVSAGDAHVACNGAADADCTLSGCIWPLIRLGATGRSRAASIHSILSGTCRIGLRLRHPVRSLRCAFLILTPLLRRRHEK